VFRRHKKVHICRIAVKLYFWQSGGIRIRSMSSRPLEVQVYSRGTEKQLATDATRESQLPVIPVQIIAGYVQPLARFVHAQQLIWPVFARGTSESGQCDRANLFQVAQQTRQLCRRQGRGLLEHELEFFSHQLFF
jgi:hypothetical protein